MPYTSVKQYNYGARLRHTLKIAISDEAEDPNSITVYLADPLGNVTSVNPTKRGVGWYEYQKTYSSATPTAVFGVWEITWRGIGNAEGARSRQFQIMSARATF